MAEPDEPRTDEIDALRREIAALRGEMQKFNNHAFVRRWNSRPRLLLMTFVRGLVTGLGTVIGATILVSVAAFLLAQVNWVPLIGDWAARIADEIQRPPNTAGE